LRREIISGSTEYRCYQAVASKQRYAIRFKTSTLTAIGFQRNGVWGKKRSHRRLSTSV